MTELDGPSGPINFLMTGFATLAIVIATVLLVVVVLVPRFRESAGLPATILALVGAIVARFTEQNTMFGDEVFRGATVYWSVALAITSALWWWVASAQSKPHPAPPVVHKASLSAGESDATVAVKTRTQTQRPPVQPSRARSRTTSPGASPNAKRAMWPVVAICGVASIAIAVATFLTATGLHPVPLPL